MLRGMLLVLSLLCLTREVSASQLSANPGGIAVLGKYCLNCHSSNKAKGGVNFTGKLDESPNAKDVGLWERVIEQTEGLTMPPDGQAKPSPGELEQLLRWAGGRRVEAQAKVASGPGRVTLRRLNRSEYNNTIRDLFGLNIRPADDFPADDVGYGFDNNGDVLSVPPILMEKYLAAAEKVAERAIVADVPSGTPLSIRMEVERMGNSAGGTPHGDWARMLNSAGEIGGDVETVLDGIYHIRVRAFAQQAGPEIAAMAFKVDGQKGQVVRVAAVEKKPSVYLMKLHLKPGKHRVAVAFLNDFYVEGKGKTSARDRNLGVDYIEVSGPIDYKPPVLPLAHRKVVTAVPSASLSERDAAKQIIERFATRAFRRPITSDDVNRFLPLFELATKNGEKFERKVQLVIEAILVSPRFLFRLELDPQGLGPGQSRALDDYEIASRLSYFIWASMPDDELTQLARGGKLRDPVVLETQTRRMLADPRSRALVTDFAGQWLQLRSLKTIGRDPKRFPTFDVVLRDAMRRESELFFETVMKEDRTILEFLDADYTFVNDRLAKHYGITEIRGDQFRRISLGNDHRGGVLTQASVLTVTSNPSRTSPVKRGKWVLEQILGTPPPPPLPNVPELGETNPGLKSPTVRQRLEAHRANPACATCHAKMDPLGFGLENFDAIGAWRISDGAHPIDATGNLPAGRTFNGPEGLKRYLLEHRQDFTRCLAKKMLTYALGRGLGDHDRAAVDRIVSAVSKDGFRFSRLIVEVALSDPFRNRSGSTQEEQP